MQYDYHLPVMLNQVIEGLAIKENGVYVDVTFGGGGHSVEILKSLGAEGKLVGFDQDEDAARNVIQDGRFIFVDQNFKYLKNFLKMYACIPVDGILADLGVSSHQFDTAERGFSIRYDASLDMRMDLGQSLTAYKVINEYEQEELADIFYLYGEIQAARKIARTIVNQRSLSPISTTKELMELLVRYAQRGKENKFYAQVFQALRIEVNQELEVLKSMLTQSLEVLKPGGRLVVIAYHSLEDRLVKNFIRTGNFEGKIEKDFYGNVQTPFTQISRKAIQASEEELVLNPRSRSAKLRIAEKK